MKTKNQDTNVKYYNFLVALKKKIDNQEIVLTDVLCEEHRVSKQLPSQLKKLNVLHGRCNSLKWNEKIPPSLTLAKKIRKNINEHHAVLRQSQKKRYNVAVSDNCKTLFDMPHIPVQKPSIKSKPKVKVKVLNNPKSELGIIRKFLKWLW